MTLHPLPPAADLETRTILKRVAVAHRHLAELKGAASSMPNESILINTLGLQEARASSEIENIVTTQDELFKAQVGERTSDPAAKEVARYAVALREGFERLREGGVLSTRLILQMQEVLEENRAGFRKLPGTAIRNMATGAVVYTPPQHHDEIVRLMSELEQFINDDASCGLDPLIKLALIHYQFESIHPFYDGNGRTGRIINVLYLVTQHLLDLPVLYLSRYIVQTKPDYYRLLQSVREQETWEEWVLYMLDAVSVTARQTLGIIKRIKVLMNEMKQRLRTELPKVYSQDLLNNLFRHPYTKIAYVQRDLNVSRPTATGYLEQLAEKGFLTKRKAGRHNYYINEPLVDCLVHAPDSPEI